MKMYKTGLGYIWLGREGKAWRAICQIIKPKRDDDEIYRLEMGVGKVRGITRGAEKGRSPQRNG
jgi:hypothetical protein